MKLTDLLLSELDREVPRSRRALEEVPPNKYDWKPHDKSMLFGHLADLVATMPSWIAMGVNMNELDVAPVGGSTMTREKHDTREALVKALARGDGETAERISREQIEAARNMILSAILTSRSVLNLAITADGA